MCLLPSYVPLRLAEQGSLSVFDDVAASNISLACSYFYPFNGIHKFISTRVSLQYVKNIERGTDYYCLGLLLVLVLIFALSSSVLSTQCAAI